MANFFKNLTFFHSGVRQTKNFRVRCPLFSLVKIKSSKPAKSGVRTHAQNCEKVYWCLLHQLSYQDWSGNRVIFFSQSKPNQTQLYLTNRNLTSMDWIDEFLGNIFRQWLVISSVCVVAINFKFNQYKANQSQLNPTNLNLTFSLFLLTIQTSMAPHTCPLGFE